MRTLVNLKRQTLQPGMNKSRWMWRMAVRRVIRKMAIEAFRELLSMRSSPVPVARSGGQIIASMRAKAPQRTSVHAASSVNRLAQPTVARRVTPA
jgi:hypothetical protein